MIKTPTIFVLGAGASYDYGFPTGAELLASLNGGNPHLIPRWIPDSSKVPMVDREKAYKATSKAHTDLKEFRRHVRESGLNPIDRVIRSLSAHEHKDAKKLARIWRLAVAQEILGAEKTYLEDFKQDHFNDQQRRKFGWKGEFLVNCDPWFRELYSRLELGANSPHEFLLNPFAIWTFNYDRLIEQLFYWALKARFWLSEADALAFVDQLRIVHIHGPVGRFAPAGTTDTGLLKGRVAFGGADHHGVLEASETLVPAHFKMDTAISTAMCEQVHDLATPRVRLVYLGFGFDPENVEKIGIRHYEHKIAEKAFTTWMGGHSQVPTQILSHMANGRVGHPDKFVFPSIRALLHALPD